jgi:hypothetical protein
MRYTHTILARRSRYLVWPVIKGARRFRLAEIQSASAPLLFPRNWIITFPVRHRNSNSTRGGR